LQQRDILSKTKTGYYGRHKFSRWRGFVIRTYRKANFRS